MIIKNNPLIQGFSGAPEGISISATLNTNIQATVSSSFINGYLTVTPYWNCGAGKLSDSLFVVGVALPGNATN